MTIKKISSRTKSDQSLDPINILEQAIANSGGRFQGLIHNTLYRTTYKLDAQTVDGLTKSIGTFMKDMDIEHIIDILSDYRILQSPSPINENLQHNIFVLLFEKALYEENLESILENPKIDYDIKIGLLRLATRHILSLNNAELVEKYKTWLQHLNIPKGLKKKIHSDFYAIQKIVKKKKRGSKDKVAP